MASGVATLVAVGGLAACPADGDIAGQVCGDGLNLETGAVGDFGTSAPALKVRAFLGAAAAVHTASLDIEADALGACQAMATDLGIPAGELAPANGELEVTSTCDRVVQEINTIIASLPAGATLGLAVAPAQCSLELDIAATCAADCDVSIEGQATVECNGELHGSCSGGCTGACTVTGNVDCTGSCTGSCTGTCSGTCTGICTGTCDVEDGAGNCIGTCTGTCEGTCDAACQGTCEGSCTGAVDATCAGECFGECDATWEAECNGDANVTANADCKAACDAQANATVDCELPEVAVVGIDVGDAAAQARVDALVATLIAHYGEIVSIIARLGYVADSIEAFVASINGAADALTDVGAKAAACVGVALEAVGEASTRIDASVEVSVQVSVEVQAEGSAQ